MDSDHQENSTHESAELLGKRLFRLTMIGSVLYLAACLVVLLE